MLCDAAQSFGATYKGRNVGAIGGQPRAFSRQSRSAATATAARSSATTPSLPHIQRPRVHGQGADKYDNVRIGLNGRLDTIQAAMLIEKLKIFRDEIERRDHIAGRYNDLLPRSPSCPSGRGLDLGVGPVHDPHPGHRRDAFPAASSAPASRPRSTTRSRSTARPRIKYPVAGNGLPVTERLASEVISLPMHPYLEEGEQDFIIDAVKAEQVRYQNPNRPGRGPGRTSTPISRRTHKMDLVHEPPLKLSFRQTLGIHAYLSASVASAHRNRSESTHVDFQQNVI